MGDIKRGRSADIIYDRKKHDVSVKHHLISQFPPSKFPNLHLKVESLHIKYHVISLDWYSYLLSHRLDYRTFISSFSDSPLPSLSLSSIFIIFTVIIIIYYYLSPSFIIIELLFDMLR